MTDADLLVSQYALLKFKELDHGRERIGTNRDAIDHLKQCPELSVRSPGHGWECQCYSDYTRDDIWQIRAEIHCPHGVVFDFVYNSPEDLPATLEELEELDDQACRYGR